nr:hypothetical protein [Tanacetum cinerariifolium]
MAFHSSPSSTNEVDTVNIQVSTASTPVSTHDNTANLNDATVYAFLANQPNGSQLVHEDLEQIHEDDLEKIDLKWPRNQDGSRKTVNVEDTSTKAMVAIDGASFNWSYMADDEAPTNMALMAFSDSEVQNSKTCSNTCLKSFETLKTQYDNLRIEFDKSKFDLATYKRGLGFPSYNVVAPPPIGLFAPPTIDFSNSGLEEFQHPEFKGYGPKEMLLGNKGLMLLSPQHDGFGDLKLRYKIISPKTVDHTFGDPKDSLKDQGYFDSRCSRHMTGNISYLTNFKEHDGRYVAFGRGAKCGKITGKGTIRTATKDETSKILKSFIIKIENLVDKKLKIIRCANGTEFKNRVMNEFCEEKGIKREYSVARTPHQNGVAERRNRTLIEAARTMLEDSKLPTTFWTEAVNTACYVQNRVLVVKPHFKTLYELFRGRSPALSFMRPFKCHVTILNTLDQLGKFDGKSDEGIFVGYSTISKAFRVYNTRTRKVQTLMILQVKDLNINAISPPINTATLTYANYPSDPLMPNLEDTGIFDDAYDDRDEGAKDEYNNLETMEPKKVTQALDDESWVEAIQEELLQFKLLNVWTLVDLPHGKRAIGTKWVFRNKKDQRGIVVRNKVVLIEAIRLFFAYASFMDFTVYQMDVKSAFLYGTIEEEVYVSQPLGFVDPEFPERVYKVEKALCGLHQAPRAWYETLSTYLLENRFIRGIIDKTLFIKKIKNDILLVQVYVDDIIFGSTQKYLSIEFEQLMHKRFQMSSMGELTFFLGLQVKQRNDGIFLSQDKYVCDILKKFGFTSVKSASTPMETYKPLSKDANETDTKIHVDYESTICVVKNHVYHSKTKHIEIRHHFIRDSYEKRLIEMVKIHTDYNVADLLVKAFDVTSSKTINSVKQIHVIVDGKAIVISESSVRIDLLFDDKDGGGDSVERAITTDASLVTTQDSDNIIKTQTTEMPNVNIPQGMDTGGSPKRQETIGGTPAQTRSERVLEQPNEPPLSEGHTSRSREGRMEHTFKLTDTVPPTPHDSPLTEEPSLDIEDSPKQGSMIRETDKYENVNLVSEHGEVHEIVEPLKDDDDTTLAETLLNIKRSTAKDKGKGIMQETGLLRKIKKREMIQLSLDEELAQKLHVEELAKESARQEQEMYNLEKALEMQKQLNQRE